MHSPVVRELVRKRSDPIEGGDVRHAHVERPARRLPRADRRQDRSHERRGLVRGRGCAPLRLHDLRGDPRQPDARAAELRPAAAARLGRLAVPHADARRPRSRTPGRRRRTACRARGARRPAAARARRARRPAARRADRRAHRGFPAGDAGRAPRPDRGLVRADTARHAAARSPPGRSRGPGSADGYGGTAPGPCTISSGSSRDRHRHPQRRRRSHAHGAELPARAPPPGERQPDVGRRQGHQRRPRAEASRLAGDRNRPRGRHDGRPDHRRARRRGDPQRLRPHRRRVAHLDRRRRSHRRIADRDLRVGARGAPRRARHAARQAALPVARRDVRRLLRLASARRRGRLLRGGGPRPEPARRRSASSTPRASRSGTPSMRSRSSSRRTSARRRASSARSSPRTTTS